jgi:hypothetical protein
LVTGRKLESSSPAISSRDTVTANLQRRLHLHTRVAEHRLFRVVPRYRGNRIAPRSLVRSVGLYDALEFREIRIRAAFYGTWYWALWGFHFADQSELARVQAHVQELSDEFGGGLDASTPTPSSAVCSIRRAEDGHVRRARGAFPQRRETYEGLAYDNNLAMHEARARASGARLAH